MKHNLVWTSRIMWHASNRRKWLERPRLAEALERTGLPVLTWDLVVSEIATRRVFYYDVMVEHPTGIGVILISPRYERDVRESAVAYHWRKQFALKCGWLFTDIFRGKDVIEMQIALEMWRLTGKQRHYPHWRKKYEAMDL